MSDEILEQNIPSMDEFKEELNESLKKIEEGDIIHGTVIGISDTEVTIDLGYYTEGIIKLDELSMDPRFSIKADIQIGDNISAMVIRCDNGQGNMLLSKKRAEDVLSWDLVKEDMENRIVRTVKLAQVVNGGLVTYLNGLRAFVPASQLSLSYVENLEEWIGKTVEVLIITADEEAKKLVLSAKEVEKDKAIADRDSKISRLQKGLVTSGKVVKIAPYGCFVEIGDELQGLVHISQICGKHIKSPNEIVKEGQEVKVKIIDIKEGKISLSMKAVEDQEEVIEDVDTAPNEYSSGEEASTGLGSLLSNLKLF